MPLFGRRRSEPPPPDEMFPFFSQEQANLFRDLVRQAFAETGLEVDVFVDHVVDASGRRYGLGNIAAVCHNDDAGERSWRELTRDHVRKIVRLMDAPSPFDTLSAAEILASTYSRVMPAQDAAQISLTYARPVADGVAEVLCLDLPESVATFTDERAREFGPIEDLWRAGRANLAAVTYDQHEVIEHDSGAIDVLVGESMFTASTVLMFPGAVREFAEIDAHGAFVALPFRHQLAFHALRDASAIPSLTLLSRFADLGFQDGVGPISPDVFWWHDGALECLVHEGPDGPRIVVEGELSDVLQELSLRSR